jgi:hypothetical protein
MAQKFLCVVVTTTESEPNIRIVTGTHFDDVDGNITKYDEDDGEGENDDDDVEVGSYLSQIDINSHDTSGRFVHQSHLYAKNSWIG